tara:strand:+ start:203 stop:460 length:258 start_codon:yes stop_codon:yes gene_type:complete
MITAKGKITKSIFSTNMLTAKRDILSPVNSIKNKTIKLFLLLLFLRINGENKLRTDPIVITDIIASETFITSGVWEKRPRLTFGG